MSRLRIFIDIDGVLANFRKRYIECGGHFDAQGRRKTGLKTSCPSCGGCNADQKVMDPQFHFWEQLEVMPGFTEYDRQLLRCLSQDHCLTFMTCRDWGGDYGDTYHQTRRWLNLKIGVPGELIVLPVDDSKAYTIYEIVDDPFNALLIDDDPKQVKEARRQSITSYLYKPNASIEDRTVFPGTIGSFLEVDYESHLQN